MLALDWAATLAALAVGVPLILLIRRLDRPMTERSLRMHERESDVSARIQETLTGIRAVQAFGQEEVESARFSGHADASLQANLRLTVLQASSQAMVGLLLAAGTAAIVYIAATRSLAGRLTTGDVVLLVAYVGMLYKPLETLAYTAAVVQGAAAGARRVFAILDTVSDVADRAGGDELLGRARGNVVFERVSFAYGEERYVLRDISLDVPVGATVALVGASGAGKTTLVNLLLRFYDPTDWADHTRWPRPPLADSSLPAPQHRSRATRTDPLQRECPREYRLQPAGSGLRGDPGGSARRGRRRLHPCAPRRLRDRDR